MQLVDGKEGMLGGAGELMEQKQFGYRMCDIAGKVIDNFKNEQWRVIVKAMLAALVDVEVGDEGTDVGLLKVWLRQYAFGSIVLPTFDKTNIASAEAEVAGGSFWDDGILCIRLMSFYRWLRCRRESITVRELSVRLTRANAESTNKAYRDSAGETKHIRVWRLPAIDGIHEPEPAGSAQEQPRDTRWKRATLKGQLYTQ
jgi:hypothetical protein